MFKKCILNNKKIGVIKMSYFYFFKNDGKCKWMINEIKKNYPKYLCDPIEFEGKKVKFYAILNWNLKEGKGANLKWVEESGTNYGGRSGQIIFFTTSLYFT